METPKANHIAINIAQTPSHSWVGVFDLDLTLGDFGTISESMQYFFPELLIPNVFLENRENKKYRDALLRSYIHLIADREIALEERGEHSGCIVRPGIVPHLYRLLEHPGCNGMAIVSNNTNQPLLHVVNYLLQAIGIRKGIKEANNRPPFCSLVHHGDPIRSLEYEKQREKNTKSLRIRRSGEVVLWNNTTKTLDTIHKLFLDKHKTRKCNRVTDELLQAFQKTASTPYSLYSSTKSPALSPTDLVKSDRIFFADDNKTHQLIREVIDVDRQFVNCEPYESSAAEEELQSLFYKAWEKHGGVERLKQWFHFLNKVGTIVISDDFFLTRLEERYETSIQEIGNSFVYDPWNDPTLWNLRISEFFQFLEIQGVKGGSDADEGVAKGGGRRTLRRKSKMSKMSKKYLKTTRSGHTPRARKS